MQKALAQAKKAWAKDEVPIGAVAVVDGKIVARAHNIKESTHNPLGHAEILLLQKLTKKQKRWRLSDVNIYVTCEPCIMCAGALWQARIGKLYFGCSDPKAGACGSLYNVPEDKRLNHRIKTTGGILAKQCAQLLSDFFVAKRKSRCHSRAGGNLLE
ncbi:MAG: tRNA adenosine(34) deaminase TadA [Pseudomonadota bacterium]